MKIVVKNLYINLWIYIAGFCSDLINEVKENINYINENKKFKYSKL